MLPFGPLRVFIRLLRHSCSFWVPLSFVSPRSLSCLFSMNAVSYFFLSRTGAVRAVVFLLHVCPVREVLFSCFPKVLVVLQGAIAASLRSTLFFLCFFFVFIAAASTLLTCRNSFWARFNSGDLFCNGAFLSCGVYNLHLRP